MSMMKRQRWRCAWCWHVNNKDRSHCTKCGRDIQTETVPSQRNRRER